MITQLRGILLQSLPTQVTIDVQGVGYEVFIPLSTYDRLPSPQQPCTLLTQLIVREDAHVLYGFATHEERDLFRLLIQHVTGVGPRMAIQILNHLSPDEFRAAILQHDVTRLSQIKGIGKKTAERIVLDLRDKINLTASPAASPANPQASSQQAATDAVLALVALGYKQQEAQTAVKQAQLHCPNASPETLLREALKLI
ncbi:MAG: Holliday junction branch migration protein RuvA [Methylacidiphilales bacterium]|nr:Holliday junction branch migration protein RuvA [Candidatus Methylacidiphilales bacterium]MDW8349976.1 Holliday junction branch migration protein RuvA [Verrucomicrobiae bacterium]